MANALVEHRSEAAVRERGHRRTKGILQNSSMKHPTTRHGSLLACASWISSGETRGHCRQRRGPQRTGLASLPSPAWWLWGPQLGWQSKTMFPQPVGRQEPRKHTRELRCFATPFYLTLSPKGSTRKRRRTPSRRKKPHAHARAPSWQQWPGCVFSTVPSSNGAAKQEPVHDCKQSALAPPTTSTSLFRGLAPPAGIKKGKQ